MEWDMGVGERVFFTTGGYVLSHQHLCDMGCELLVQGIYNFNLCRNKGWLV